MRNFLPAQTVCGEQCGGCSAYGGDTYSEPTEAAKLRRRAALRRETSPLRPFKHAAFAVVWTATVVSNIGGWMQSAAAGWLMTTLDADPRMVAMVQVATMLPMFLLGLPAGALADILDRRRLLLVVETMLMFLIGALALLVALHRVTAFDLLSFTFLQGVASALDSPTWQAIVPQLVGPEDLAPAVALNSAGINISRAIGPALTGLVIAWWGMSSPFWIDSAASLGVIAALFWWRAGSATRRTLPPERFGSAILVGLRHARYNPRLRATLVRATGFFIFAAAYWALLPLVAKNQIAGSAGLYGLLLGVIGAGAVAGAFALPRFRTRLGTDGLITLGSIGTALALFLFGAARQPAVAFVASVLAGVSWIIVVATLNVSAQMALPGWVRGRGLAVYATVMFGAMTLGSLVWGQVASLLGLSAAHYLAAGGALLAVPLLHRWKLQSGAVLDLAPSMHWPEPVVTAKVDDDRGPVLVTLEYHIAAENRDAFLQALRRVAAERKRDGAYDWGIFEDTSVSGRWLETFLVDSWIEHQRQHRRVTNADKLAEAEVRRFQTQGAPKVTHFIAPES
jgi:MFS family permease